MINMILFFYQGSFGNYQNYNIHFQFFAFMEKLVITKLAKTQLVSSKKEKFDLSDVSKDFAC